MKRHIPIIYGLIIFFVACSPFDLKPLDVHTVKNGNNTVRWFFTSSITTVHNHVEVKTQHGWEQIMEADGNSRTSKIYNVKVIGDSILIYGNKDMLIYELRSVYWGRYVRFDTSMSDSVATPGTACDSCH